MSALFTASGLGMSYNGIPVLAQLDLEFPAGQMISVAGPNGAGKSTLLAVLAGLRREYSGACRYKGKEVRRWPRKAFAREVAFVPQSVRIEFPFTVEQVVLMGRTPYCDGLFESPEDWAAAERAMRLADVLELRKRDFRSLSGGEKQRAILASVLAQSPQALLLDEPATFLDLQHQFAIYGLLQSLARGGILVVAATHDLNLASVYSDRVFLMCRGRVYCDAPPERALTPETIREVFGVSADVICHAGGKPWVLYGGA